MFASVKPLAATLICVEFDYTNPLLYVIKKPTRKGGFLCLVGVSGFEPEASWTRTKRDTKLRHTPITSIL